MTKGFTILKSVCLNLKCLNVTVCLLNYKSYLVKGTRLLRGYMDTILKTPSIKFFFTLNNQSIPVKSDEKYCSRCTGTKTYYKPKPIRKAKCKACGGAFETRRVNQSFCNDGCRFTFHVKKKWTEKRCGYCKRLFKSSKDYQDYCCTGHYIKAKHKRDHENYTRSKEQ